MKITAESTLADVCFAVCTVLDQAKIVAVLSGGSAATIYAPATYQSNDADFIITLHGSGGSDALKSIGYAAARDDIYRHPNNEFTVEFPAGPLAIGDDLIRTWDTLRRGDEVLYILSRTDCIRDRLLWFYLYSDRSALAAAQGVAASGDIDLGFIRQWSINGGFGNRYLEFAEQL